MLTRHEVLDELRRIGVKDHSRLKECLEDFEYYMQKNYGLKIVQTNFFLRALNNAVNKIAG